MKCNNHVITLNPFCILLLFLILKWTSTLIYHVEIVNFKIGIKTYRPCIFLLLLFLCGALHAEYQPLNCNHTEMTKEMFSFVFLYFRKGIAMTIVRNKKQGDKMKKKTRFRPLNQDFQLKRK